MRTEILFKGIVVLMIVGLQKSIPYVVKSSPEITITGLWLKKEIDSYIFTLQNTGFNVRAVIADDHSTNVSAFSYLHGDYDGDSTLFIYHPAYNGLMKTYLFFDIIHIIKNLRNNLLNRKKFVFPAFSFDLFLDKIDVPSGYITWSLFHQIYEKDQTLNANLKKAPKITCKVIHPGNNKQSVPLALAIFDETTSAAIQSYYPERKDAASLLTLFNKLFIIFNSKQQFNHSNKLGNASVQGVNKPTFFRKVANWIENWSTCPFFTLTPQTSHALITTLRSSAMLIEELLDDGYNFVLTAKFQSDPLELRFSKYRQMSGGRFLVSLLEVCNSEKILAVRSLLKENINIWEEDLAETVQNEQSIMAEIEKEISAISTELLECQLSEDSMQVAVFVAGYIAKKLCKRSKCDICPKTLCIMSI